MTSQVENMRDSQYHLISKHLGKLNDCEIAELLEQGALPSSGTGGTLVKLEVEGSSLFVKQIPLNDREKKLDALYSTKNLFECPLYYQYGINSAGFSCWREWSAHLMSTNWVLSNESQSFPLMYHWRILDNSRNKRPLDEEELNKYVAYWNGSSAIGERFKANYQASSHLALFMEFIPETLHSWLEKQSAKGQAALEEAIKMVEQKLKEITDFLYEKKMLHFDAHFKNILTDGKQLYFSDFGLAMSSQFAFSKEEEAFFKSHRNYDRCYVSAALTNWIVSKLVGKERLAEVLQDYAQAIKPHSLPKAMTPFLSSLVKRYASLTLTMNHFFARLINQSKLARYPADELELLWNHASNLQQF